MSGSFDHDYNIALDHSPTVFVAFSQTFKIFFKPQTYTHLWYKSKKACPCKIKEFLNEWETAAGHMRPKAEG